LLDSEASSLAEWRITNSKLTIQLNPSQRNGIKREDVHLKTVQTVHLTF